MRRVFCTANLPHGGLGSRLFAWANSVIFSYKNNIPLLSPRWYQLKTIGPFLRKEEDKRMYFNLFNKKKGEMAAFFRVLLKLISLKKKLTVEMISKEFKNKKSLLPQLYVFEGEGNYFGSLNGWNDLLLKEIHEITKKKWLDKVAEFKEIPIGMHIRRGDFTAVDETRIASLESVVVIQIPLPWYVNTLKRIRAEQGRNVPAYVCSDGRYEELKELLDLPNVTWIKTGSAIGDILTLSKSKLFLSSQSSFSGWISYFGQMPTLCYPGRLLGYNLVNKAGIYEFDPKNEFSTLEFQNILSLVGTE